MGSAPPVFQVFDNPHSFVNSTLLRVSGHLSLTYFVNVKPTDIHRKMYQYMSLWLSGLPSITRRVIGTRFAGILLCFVCLSVFEIVTILMTFSCLSVTQMKCQGFKNPSSNWIIKKNCLDSVKFYIGDLQTHTRSKRTEMKVILHMYAIHCSTLL